MGSVKIGAARHDEHGKLSGGALGDNTGHEVEIYDFKNSSKDYYIFRAKDEETRKKLADAMENYCKDNKVGYDQSNRTAIMKYDGKKPTECDCSSLVRRCIRDATGIDVGNFTTATEKKVLEKSGFFILVGKYSEGIAVMRGDIACTCSKGHTGIITAVSIAVKIDKSATYQKGCTYQTNCNLYVRELPDKTAKAVKVLPAGTRITAKDITFIDGNIWIRHSLGWSAAYYNGKVRIV